MKHITKDKNLHTSILNAMEDVAMNGDAYTDENTLYRLCTRSIKGMDFLSFEENLHILYKEDKLHREGRRIYLTQTWRYEESAAENLADILNAPHLDKREDPTSRVGDIALTDEQNAAVEMALSNRLSMILGGAGCGKTTLIRAIASATPEHAGCVLCAPTGKAARNLAMRTKCIARTVHSALGMHPNEDFLRPVEWSSTYLLVVDEASMMSLEMLAGILHRVPKECRVVLVGDPNQLLSVGAGNVLPDLMTLGVPYCILQQNHRQKDASYALTHNVADFTNLQRISELAFDESFSLLRCPEADIQRSICEEAAAQYRVGSSIQVLSPVNVATGLSVKYLNRRIQKLANPPTEDIPEVIMRDGSVFREGDRVMLRLLTLPCSACRRCESRSWFPKHGCAYSSAPKGGEA